MSLLSLLTPPVTILLLCREGSGQGGVQGGQGGALLLQHLSKIWSASAVQCSAVQCSELHCRALQCSPVPCSEGDQRLKTMHSYVTSHVTLALYPPVPEQFQATARSADSPHSQAKVTQKRMSAVVDLLYRMCTAERKNHS